MNRFRGNILYVYVCACVRHRNKYLAMDVFRVVRYKARTFIEGMDSYDSTLDRVVSRGCLRREPNLKSIPIKDSQTLRPSATKTAYYAFDPIWINPSSEMCNDPYNKNYRYRSKFKFFRLIYQQNIVNHDKL